MVMAVMCYGDVMSNELFLSNVGFNVETIEQKNVKFTVWDIGGQEKVRQLWRHYYRNTSAIIFVIDSNDRERIDDSNGVENSARDELNRLLAEGELRDAALLVFANKQDLPNTMSVNEITERLGLNSLRQRRWFIQASCAMNGEGLEQGLEWLSQTLHSK